MFGMSDDADDSGRQPTRREISDATESSGWRYILGVLRTAVRVGSLAQGAEVTAQAVAAVGADADETLSIDVRRDSVVLTLQTAATASVTRHDIAAARRISEALLGLGLQTDPDVEAAPRRSVQVLEIAIDATDIAAIRPFWKAVMGYGDEAGRSGPEDPLVDPVGQGPAIWFQQMDTPRPQRNRIHFDVSVPHDEAQGRIRAALDAGGSLVSDAWAPAFWVLADSEGNEACVTTWQGRDG